MNEQEARERGYAQGREDAARAVAAEGVRISVHPRRGFDQENYVWNYTERNAFVAAADVARGSEWRPKTDSVAEKPLPAPPINVMRAFEMAREAAKAAKLAAMVQPGEDQ